MRSFSERRRQLIVEAVGLNTRTLSRLYHDRTHQHRGFSAVDMAMITLLMSPDKRLIRDDKVRWNHPHAERHSDGSFQQGFSANTINKLIDAKRCEAVKWGGRGTPVEVRLLPL